MTDEIASLHRSIATLVRVLKITESAVATAHGELKLRLVDTEALRFIAEHPKCMSSALADHLGVVPTTATGVVDRLVEREFVLRERPIANRRAVALSLTGEGRAVLDQIDAGARAISARILAALPCDQRSTFVQSMAVIADELERRPR